MTYPRDLSTCPYAVYRIYDRTGRLLYVGISCDPDARLDAHRHTAGWFREYDHHHATWYDGLDDAKAAETAAIEMEHPVHNKAHNRPTRIKPTRITVDLDLATYTELNRWLGSAAVAVNPDFPRLSLAEAVRAMIRATARDETVSGVVIGLLRDTPATAEQADTGPGRQ